MVSVMPTSFNVWTQDARNIRALMRVDAHDAQRHRRREQLPTLHAETDNRMLLRLHY